MGDRAEVITDIHITDSRHITLYPSQQAPPGSGNVRGTAGSPTPQTLRLPQMARGVRPSPCSPTRCPRGQTALRKWRPPSPSQTRAPGARRPGVKCV